MKKLYRSNHDRKLTGLCGGLAEVLNVDATLLRLVVAVAAFFSAGVVIPLYLIASLVIPKEQDSLDFAGWSGVSGAVPVKKWGYGPGGWRTAGEGPEVGGWGHTHSNSALDAMMDALEKKAMEKELQALRAKLKQYESGHPKGEG